MKNIEHIATEILSKKVRLVSKKKFENKDVFRTQVNDFINTIKSDSVHLNLTNINFSEDKTDLPYQHWKIEFEVIFSFNDPYIDNKLYETGTVFIFPSKKFYDDVEKQSLKMFEAYPEWDETKLRASITGNARAY